MQSFQYFVPPQEMQPTHPPNRGLLTRNPGFCFLNLLYTFCHCFCLQGQVAVGQREKKQPPCSWDHSLSVTTVFLPQFSVPAWPGWLQRYRSARGWGGREGKKQTKKKQICFTLADPKRPPCLFLGQGEKLFLEIILSSPVQSWSYFWVPSPVCLFLFRELREPLGAYCLESSVAFNERDGTEGTYSVPTVTGTPPVIFKLLYPIWFLRAASYRNFSSGEHRPAFGDQPTMLECGWSIVFKEQVQLTSPAQKNAMLLGAESTLNASP